MKATITMVIEVEINRFDDLQTAVKIIADNSIYPDGTSVNRVRILDRALISAVGEVMEKHTFELPIENHMTVKGEQ